MTSSETGRGSLSQGQTCQLVQSRPWRTTSRRRSAAQINLSEDLPLFRALATSRSKEKVRSQGISYTRARELITDAFRDITDVSKISVHSLKAGGATSAANAGIADRLLKRHGRWVSENAKDGYVKDDFNSRLSVTKSLESDLYFIVIYLFIFVS